MLWLDSWIWKCVKLNLNDSYCNGYVCKCVWLTPHNSTCHNYDAFLKWRDDLLSSTGAPAQHERWLTGSFCRPAYNTGDSNTGCFEVGPAIVCAIAIFEKAQQGHRCNVSLRYEWFWEMSYIFHYVCLFWGRVREVIRLKTFIDFSPDIPHGITCLEYSIPGSSEWG